MKPTENSEEHNVTAYWYSAESQFGRLCIGIDEDDESKSEQVVDSTNLIKKIQKIEQCEFLICEIEEWFQCGLVLIPIARDDIETEHLITIESKQIKQDGFSGKLYISISDAILAKLTIPTEKLSQIATIHTSNISTEFVVSKLGLPESQEDEIMPGNILLIPDTFDLLWFVELRPLYHDVNAVIASMQSDRRTIKINSADMVGDFTDNHCETENDNKTLIVKLKNILQLPFGLIFGWDKSDLTLLSKSITTETIEIILDGACKGTGYLLAVSSGYGVYIDNINTSE